MRTDDPLNLRPHYRERAAQIDSKLRLERELAAHREFVMLANRRGLWLRRRFELTALLDVGLLGLKKKSCFNWRTQSLFRWWASTGRTIELLRNWRIAMCPKQDAS